MRTAHTADHSQSEQPVHSGSKRSTILARGSNKIEEEVKNLDLPQVS